MARPNPSPLCLAYGTASVSQGNGRDTRYLARRRRGHTDGDDVRQPPTPTTAAMIGRPIRIRAAPSTSNEMPDLIIVVIGTTPEP